jgi:hypothetical protein
MKSKIIIVALGIITLTACTKSAVNNNSNTPGNTNVVAASSVPAAVINSFNNSFRGATEVEWQHNSSHSFNSQFNLSSQRHDAGFDDNGNSTSHSIICLDAAVPQAVLDAFRQRYPTDNVFEWKLMNTGEWKAHLMRGAIKYEATFNATGTFISFEQSR